MLTTNFRSGVIDSCTARSAPWCMARDCARSAFCPRWSTANWIVKVLVPLKERLDSENAAGDDTKPAPAGIAKAAPMPAAATH